MSARRRVPRARSVLLAAAIGAVLPAASRAQEPDSALQAGNRIVVMVNGQLEGTESFGAGIVFGRDRGYIYVATANHVVRAGGAAATDIRIRFRDRPDQPVPAVLTEHFDAARLDLAVLRIEQTAAGDVAFCTLPLDRLPDPDSIRRGAAVFPTGQPVGAPWGAPVAPDLIAQVTGNDVTFQSSFISAGHSGGALLTENGAVAGMIRRDQPPFGTAVAVGAVLDALRRWGYPVHLRRPPDEPVRSPLHGAAERGDVAAARRLLEGCATNDRDDTGFSPLHIAAAHGNAEIVTLLLEAGAAIDARTDDPPHYEVTERTALHLAAAAGSPRAVRVLIEHGADVKAEARGTPGTTSAIYGGTALHFAAAAGSVDIVRLLLAAGADLEARADPGGTALAVAAEHGRIDVVRQLIAAKAKLEADRDSPLHAAAAHGHVAVIRALIDAGANVAATESPFDRTALHDAAEAGHADAVRALIEAGAPRDAVASGGLTALHYAARNGRLEAARVLLDKGANVNARNREGRTPLALVPGIETALSALIESRGGIR